MTCFNEKLPINLKQMKTVLLSELENIINNQLDYVFEENDKKVKKIENTTKCIIKELKDKLNTDLFIQRMIHNDHCIYKHTRGKKDGNICCNKITTNGDSKKWLCRTHNKNHIPKKRKYKTDLLKFNVKYKNTRTDNINGIFSLKIDNNNKEDIPSKDKSLKYNTNRYNLKRNKKLHITRFNINSFKNIMNNYENIICKFNQNCQNLSCKYKHTNKEMLIKDFLYYNINNSILTF